MFYVCIDTFHPLIVDDQAFIINRKHGNVYLFGAKTSIYLGRERLLLLFVFACSCLSCASDLFDADFFRL